MKDIFELFEESYAQHKSIPSFNFNDIWDVRAICEVAEEKQTPVLLMAYLRVVESHGLDLIVAIVKTVRKEYSVPIYLHLDHCDDAELCIRAIDAGFDSVMFDGSAMSLEDNISLTKRVVEYAHKHHVLVEAEIGKIRGRGNDALDFLAAVDDVKQLSEQTNVDLIAVGIGTAHGHYEGEPELNFERLKEINDAVGKPLVLHGGTGIPAEDIRKSITMGIVKVNVGTAIHTAYMQNLGKQIAKDGMDAYPSTSIAAILPEVKKEARNYIESITE